MRVLLVALLLICSLVGQRAEADGLTPLISPPVYVAVLPNSRSLQVHETGSVFIAAINPNSFALTNCFPVLDGDMPPGLYPFQPTDPATNQLIGQQQQHVDIPAGGTQTWIQFMTPSVTSPTVEIEAFIACDGFDEVGVTPRLGVSTFTLSADLEQPPDIISIALAMSRDGVARLPQAYGIQAFAVATINLGAPALITASMDTGLIDVPVTMTICQTTASGACMAPPAATVSTQIDAGATPTFAVFLQGQDVLPFDPELLRVFVNFTDEGGALRGSTSVAVADPTPMPSPSPLGGIYTGGMSGPESDPASLNGPVFVAISETGQAFGLTQSGAVFQANLANPVPPNFGGQGYSSTAPNTSDPLKGAPFANFIFDGVQISRHWVGGYYFVNFTEGRIDLSYQPSLYERPSSLATLKGSWSLRETATGPVIANISIDSAGQISGTDAQGTAYNGNVQIIDARYNAYQINLQIRPPGIDQISTIPSGLGVVMDTAAKNLLIMAVTPGTIELVTYTLTR